jgi:hypothetical protein
MESRVDLDKIVGCCGELLERMHKTSVGEYEMDYTLYNIVALKLFGYALNTFKSIYYLLPHTVYEQASALYRTLLESGVNLEWIAIEPESRAQRFLNFTVVEYVRFLNGRLRTARHAKDANAILALSQQLGTFQKLVEQQLDQFTFRDRAGRKKSLGRFSKPTLDAVVREVGGEWVEEYERDYLLSCAYTHSAPGAVLFPLYDTPDHDVDKVRSTERAGIVGAGSIEVMGRVYRRWLAAREMEDSVFLQELSFRVRSANRA